MDKTTEKFFTSRDKTLAKLLFLVYLSWVIILNWGSLSWFLNLRTAPLMIQETALKLSQSAQEKFSSITFPEFSFLGKSENKKPEEDISTKEPVDEPEEVIDPRLYCENNQITIPSLDVTAPIVETGGITEKEYRESLDRGVVHFPGSSFPGEGGLSVLLGHSAPAGWPKIKYDWVFTEIEKLEEGDVVKICYNNRKWTYIIIEEEIGKKIYEVGEDVPPLFADENKGEIVLMTCWPPGSRDNRIGLRGILEE